MLLVVMFVRLSLRSNARPYVFVLVFLFLFFQNQTADRNWEKDDLYREAIEANFSEIH